MTVDYEAKMEAGRSVGRNSSPRQTYKKRQRDSDRERMKIRMISKFWPEQLEGWSNISCDGKSCGWSPLE